MEVFKTISDTNNWWAIWPEITLGVMALMMLLLDLAAPARKYFCAPFIAMATLAAVFVLLLLSGGTHENLGFAGMIMHTSLSEVMRMFFLISALVVSYMGSIYLAKQHLPRVEFYHTIIVGTAALMLLVQSNHFVMFFVALETFTVSLFILVSYCRESSYSLEAGLKYLVMAALSSSILLFGIMLLYGAAGNPLLPNYVNDAMNFAELGRFIASNPDNLMVQIGALLVICGVAFKIGVVPFQIWIPDVYQGSPTPVTAFLAVSSKAAGFIVLVNLLFGPFIGLKNLMIPLLSVIAAVTILFGNITAIPQTNVKRLMGLSGISHAGYMLLAIIAAYSVSWAVGALVFYLYTYMLGSFAVFCVMGLVSGKDDEYQDLEQYENFSKKNPFLGRMLVVGIGSLAGIPPFAGFIGKLLVFIAAFKAHLYLLLGVAIFGVVVSIYYYFGWLRDAFFYVWKGVEEEEPNVGVAVIPLTLVNKLVLGTIAILTLVLGVYQGVFGGMILMQ